MFQILLNVASQEYEKEFPSKQPKRKRVKYFSPKLQPCLRKDNNLENFLVDDEKVFMRNPKGEEYFAFHREGKIWFNDKPLSLAQFSAFVYGWPKNGWEVAFIKDACGEPIFLNDLPNREGVLRKHTTFS